MDIGSFVRMKRREMNLSQTQLAQRAGVGLNFVYQLEKNKPTVQLNCARQVLNALGFDFSLDPLVTNDIRADENRMGASATGTKTFSLPWD